MLSKCVSCAKHKLRNACHSVCTAFLWTWFKKIIKKKKKVQTRLWCFSVLINYHAGRVFSVCDGQAQRTDVLWLLGCRGVWRLQQADLLHPATCSPRSRVRAVHYSWISARADEYETYKCSVTEIDKLNQPTTGSHLMQHTHTRPQKNWQNIITASQHGPNTDDCICGLNFGRYLQFFGFLSELLQLKTCQNDITCWWCERVKRNLA